LTPKTDNMAHTHSNPDHTSDGTRILNRLLLSSLSLVLAFILAQLFLQFMVYAFSGIVGISATFGYNDVLVPMDFHIWRRFYVMIVNLLPQFICLVIALFLYSTLAPNRSEKRPFQMFAYWLMICLLNNFLSHLLFSVLGMIDEHSQFYQTFARAALWLYVPVAVAMIFPVLAVLGAFFAGFLLTPQTVRLAHTRRLTQDKHGKNLLVIQYYVLPYIISIVPLLLLSKSTTWLRMSIILLNLGILPLGMFFRNSLGPYHVEFEKTNHGNRFPAIELALSVSLMLVVYFFLK